MLTNTVLCRGWSQPAQQARALQKLLRENAEQLEKYRKLAEVRGIM